MNSRIFCFLLAFLGTCAGCANISSPTGGKKDIRPPRLMHASPADSQVNTRTTRVELQFDEYITLADASKEITISPILLFPPVVTSLNKHVVVKIADSLLEENTTYRISFGNAVRDLHESNPFPKYTYTFSTGSYFDSLELSGNVVNAESGLPDTSGILVVLHKASDNDSAIVKKKPRYIAKPDNKGAFRFKGLPGKDFRIYAVKDDNSNMTYDGGTELIAFNDAVVTPGDSAAPALRLRLFAEVQDTVAVKDSVKTTKKGFRSRDGVSVTDTNLTYTINIDTSDIAKRTYDLTDSLKLIFNKIPMFDLSKIHLTRDSAGLVVDVPLAISKDKKKLNILNAPAAMQENTVYTLRIDTAFATDTTGKAVSAARYRFRTFNKDDYGKIHLNLPGKYGSSKPSGTGSSKPAYLLVALAGSKQVYLQKITDTVVSFTRLKPETYFFRIIEDKNGNGKWDGGDLFAKVQPEVVIPGPQPILLKAGWEHTVDFENKPKPAMKAGTIKDKASPKK